jgi:phosphoglycolate phosphatase-like HAD superfamily hydrolase
LRPGRLLERGLLFVSHMSAFESAGLAVPKVLLCDLDGTLVDSMPALAELATEVIEAHYSTPRVLAHELCLTTRGVPFAEQLEQLFPDDPRNGEAAAGFEAARAARCDAIRMAPETRQALERLRARGVRLVVSSSSTSADVERFAKATEFPFDLLLGVGPDGAKGPAHLDAASRAFEVGRQEMLFVGDSLRDGEIAEREGVPFVGLATTFSPERFALRFPEAPVIRRFAALPELFR